MLLVTVLQPQHPLWLVASIHNQYCARRFPITNIVPGVYFNAILMTVRQTKIQKNLFYHWRKFRYLSVSESRYMPDGAFKALLILSSVSHWTAHRCQVIFLEVLSCDNYQHGLMTLESIVMLMKAERVSKLRRTYIIWKVSKFLLIWISQSGNNWHADMSYW